MPFYLLQDRTHNWGLSFPYDDDNVDDVDDDDDDDDDDGDDDDDDAFNINMDRAFKAKLTMRTIYWNNVHSGGEGGGRYIQLAGCQVTKPTSPQFTQLSSS